MSKLKIWLEQTMMISFAILAGIVIEGVVFYFIDGDSLDAFAMNWYQLLAVVLTGAVCALPSFIWFSEKEITKAQFIVKLIIHCASIYAVVSLIGWLFNWYSQLDGFILMSIIYVLVYIFVWLVTLWFHRRDDNKINKALDEIRDEE